MPQNSGAADDLPSPRGATPPPYTLAGWRSLDAVARRLIGIRLLRSVSQGALTVDFVLYLRQMHWSAAAIGSLLAASGLAGTALMLAGGVLSDRCGRRPFLLAYEALMTFGGAALAVHPRSWVLVTVAVALGYGRGANGAAGPFGPVEQAWLANAVESRRRGQVFSLNATAGFWGMGIGSLIGSAVPLFARLWPGTGAYEPLFVLVPVVAAVNVWQLALLREEAPRRPVPVEAARAARPEQHSGPAAPPAPEHEAAVWRRENLAMALLTGVNAVNSFGIGLFSPLLPYWFAVRFGAGSGAIGSLFGLTFLVTGISSLITGQLAARVGLVRSVVWVRVGGAVLLLAMPLSPTYTLAGAAYLLRSAFNRGSAGARQAFGVSLVRDHRRGLASSLNALSMRLPSAAAPALSGWLMAEGSLDLPFYLSAALQVAYIVLFATVLGRYDAGGPAAAAD
jgi:MFS family permease